MSRLSLRVLLRGGGEDEQLECLRRWLGAQDDASLRSRSGKPWRGGRTVL